MREGWILSSEEATEIAGIAFPNQRMVEYGRANSIPKG
jgi:hypothetical protein